MPPMKPLPHVHTYVLNGKGERISKCIYSHEHPKMTFRALVGGLAKAVRALFTAPAAARD